MATNYTKTDNFSLNLYGDSDPADLRDGYNGSMRTIDDTLEKHLNRIETLEATDTHDAEVLKALGADTVDNATTAKTKWDQAATDATTAITDATTNNGLLAALGADTTDHATTAKTKWDQAATDTTTNKGLLAALGATTTDQATAAKTKWDKASDTTTANTTQIATILERLALDRYQDGYLVTFGDSYADNTQNRTWSYQLSQMLTGLTWKNYAKSGAGFEVPNIHTFKQQVNDCVADTSVDKTKVKIAVCAGGRNDILDWSAANTSAIATVTAMQDAFPNALIVIAPMLYDSGTLDTTGLPKYSGLMDGAQSAAQGNARTIVLDHAFVWGKGLTNLYPSGDIHPTENGAKMMAKYLFDGCHDRYRGRMEFSQMNIGSMEVDFSLANGVITASGQGSITTIGEGVGSELNKWAYPRSNVWAWGVSAGNSTNPKLYYIQSNGKWGLFGASSNDTGNCAINFSYNA